MDVQSAHRSMAVLWRGRAIYKGEKPRSRTRFLPERVWNSRRGKKPALGVGWASAGRSGVQRCQANAGLMRQGRRSMLEVRPARYSCRVLGDAGSVFTNKNSDSVNLGSNPSPPANIKKGLRESVTPFSCAGPLISAFLYGWALDPTLTGMASHGEARLPLPASSDRSLGFRAADQLAIAPGVAS